MGKDRPVSQQIWTPQSLHRGTSLALRKPGICMRGVELPQNEVELKTCSLFVAPRSFLTHPRRATNVYIYRGMISLLRDRGSGFQTKYSLSEGCKQGYLNTFYTKKNTLGTCKIQMGSPYQFFETSFTIQTISSLRPFLGVFFPWQFLICN